MTHRIEEIDRQQQRMWKIFLIAFCLLFVLLTVRYVFGTVLAAQELNSRPVGLAVLGLSVLLLVTLVVTIVRLGLLRVRIRRDAILKEALIDNELVKHHLSQSWKPAFIAAIATPFLFLLLSAFYSLDDPLLVALATCNVGCGTFLISFFVKSNQ